MPNTLKNDQEYVYDAWLHWSLSTNKCSLNCTYCSAGHGNNVSGKKTVDMLRVLRRIRRLLKLKLPYFIRAVSNKITQRSGKLITIDIPSLIKTLDKTNKIFRISFTSDGEPFLIPNLVEALLEISKKHYVNFCTNLVTGRIDEFLNKVDPKKVPPITASLHIKALKEKKLLDRYIKNYKIAQDKGIIIINQVVAYPPLADQVEHYKSFFAGLGMVIHFCPFCGEYEGRTYPESYTEQEIKIFDLSSQLEKHHMKGKVCNAGYNAANVSPAGNIQPCVAFDEYLGNVYYEIKFDNKLRKCPVQYCSCAFNACDPLLFKKALTQCDCP